MKNEIIYQISQLGANKIKKFISFFENEINQKKELKFRNKIYKIFSFDPKNNTIILNKENNSEKQLLTKTLNFNLQLISLIIFQEYEIIKLQNFQKVSNNEYLYELLYLGLKEKFLEYLEVKPIIEAFYQTNRITKNQYLTLVNHYYLEDKEYEE